MEVYELPGWPLRPEFENVDSAILSQPIQSLSPLDRGRSMNRDATMGTMK